MYSGLDLNLNEHLETEGVVNQTVREGRRFNGTNGTMEQEPLDKVTAPACDSRLVRCGRRRHRWRSPHRFAQQSEVRETLNFCFEPLRSERVSDVVSGESTITRPPKLAVHRQPCRASSPPTTASTVANSMFIQRRPPPWWSTPAATRCGFSVVDDGERLLFDATDGATARRFLVSEGHRSLGSGKPGVGQRLVLPFNHQPTCLDQRSLESGLTLPHGGAKNRPSTSLRVEQHR